MNETKPILLPRVQRARLPHHLRELLHRLLFETHLRSTHYQFLRKAVGILLEFAGCDLLEVRIDEMGRVYRCQGSLDSEGQYRFDGLPPAAENPIMEEILDALLRGEFAAAAPFTSRYGSFWVSDSARPILLRSMGRQTSNPGTMLIGGRYQSLVVIPFPVTERSNGLLYLASLRREYFSKDDVLFYEVLAVTLGVAIANQAAQWALRERVKELSCLYGIAKVIRRREQPLDEILQEVVALLPPGWQYPEITSARITVGARTYETTGFVDAPFKQTADIVVKGEHKGRVEVVYGEARPTLDEGPFLKEERNLIDAVAESLGEAISFEAAQLALRERVKELTCLHGIAKVAQRSAESLEQLLTAIVDLLPPGFLYPDFAAARIVLDQQEIRTAGFTEFGDKLGAEIAIGGRIRGLVEVVYLQPMPELDEGPFLKEERSLLDEVARQVGLIVERREAEAEKAELQRQLRHADRLATIGQLAAGTAHELNEPLGSILGFAELAKGAQRLPKQVRADLERIIEASLHAREVIKKLMIFARQMPTQMSPVDLNEVVSKSLLFLESRIVSEGIRLGRRLSPDLPLITADASQLQQVLVNLVVNAVQAMPSGGKLTVGTARQGQEVLLTVEDTGAGMNEEILKQIFIPFFTTKQVGQGTGLGLSVVHGIVTSHGGTIRVESRPGEGSRFEVRLPTAPRSAEEENR